MRYAISDLLLTFVPLAFLLMAVVPWPECRQIKWERFSLDSLTKHLVGGKNVVVFARTRHGVLNPWVERTFDQRRVRRAFSDGNFVAMDIELAYASPTPRGQEHEISWLMNLDIDHKDAFVVIVRSDRSTLTLDPFMLTPERLLSALSIGGYSDLFLRALCFLCFVVSLLLALRQRLRHGPNAFAG